MSQEGKLIAVENKGGTSGFETGSKQALFQVRRPIGRGPLLFTNYAPTADGQRFLINTLASDVAPVPITVILNWSGLLRK
jgi:hypothetical protein